MDKVLELRTGNARLGITPEIGGGIAHLNVAGRPVLRPWSGDVGAGPFALACNVLVPFSNRISGGGFECNGRWHDVAPNLSFQKHPIHGDGFQKPWKVSKQGQSHATITLDQGGSGPYSYRAEQVFKLTDTDCRVTLSMTNTGDGPMLFGGGFHPWFPRNDETRLGFSARSVWLADEEVLPTEEIDPKGNPDWDFANARPLPDRLVDNCYTGWAGAAKIIQGNDFVSVDVTASDNLNYALVHSVGKGCDFLCFEPVSHPVDAFNMPGNPGLKELEPGQTLTCWMDLNWA